MKTLATSLIGFLLVLSVSGMTTFEKNYIRNFRESGKAVRQTSDGGYIIAAVSEFSQTYLIRANSNGDTLWTKLYDGVCYDILEEMDGSFVLCGAMSGNALLRKVDSNGLPLWIKTFGGTSDEVAYSLLQTVDGGFMFCGYTQSLGTEFQSVYCVRTDFAGDPVWEKYYSKLAVSEGVAIRELSVGNFLICGNANIISKGPTLTQVVLIKIDFNSGDTIWTRNFMDGTGTLCTSFAETSDNGFLLCGSIGLLPSGSAVSLLQFDPNGSFQWSKILTLNSSNSQGNWIERTDDDNFIVTGNSDNNLFVFKADNAGDTLWTRFYNNSTMAKGSCIQQTSDGGYVVCGQSGSSTTAFSTYLIKTDDAGLLTSIGHQQSNDMMVCVFPNPATDILNIDLPDGSKATSIELIDMMGITKIRMASAPSTMRQTIDLHGLAKGCYIIRVQNEDKSFGMSKVVVE
jgi:hypothetical protein